MIGLIVICGGAIAVFYIAYDINKDFLDDTTINIEKSEINFIALFIFLGIINPFMEEW